jgi:hypothetical protein
MCVIGILLLLLSYQDYSSLHKGGLDSVIYIEFKPTAPDFYVPPHAPPMLLHSFLYVLL